jgi:amidophosphoribosyltransferase
VCGVIGVIGPHLENNSEENTPFWAAYEAYRGLLTLQHRGQDAAGILTYDKSYRRFFKEKNLGLIANVFNQKNIESLLGNMAIGHTRYATTGSDDKGDLQPMVTGSPFGIGMAHNGNLVNCHSLSESLKEEHHYQLLTSNDLEIILRYFAHFYHIGKKEKAFNFEVACNAVKKVYEVVDGGYGVVGLIADAGLIAFRDPKGIRPLSLGRKEIESKPGQYKYCVSSETVAINFLGYEIVRDIEPGEFIFIDLEGRVHSKVVKEEKIAPCMFEWVYFSGAESTMHGKSVYTARLNLGKQLAKKAKKLIDDGVIKPDVVMPVPDTSRTAAISVAQHLGVDYREGLIKNRYIHRSFILNTQEKREKAIELKLSPIRSEIEGKNILLVDDSVVRGTTSKKIISLLKRYGAKDIFLGVTCPPLRYGCYYGVDFPSKQELIANGKKVDEISKYINAENIIYIDEQDLKEAIGISDLCMACVNGKYPTNALEGEKFAKSRRSLRNENL